MNILYIPQLSMYDKQTGKYIPESDGNLNMMRNFINEWNHHRPNDYFNILLPEEVWKWYDGIKANRTKIYYKQFVTSARINRFNFPMNEITKVIAYDTDKIDLVINDIPELSRNIIAMFEVNFGYCPQIMSNIHHMDDIYEHKSKYSYFLRVIDAIECSNYITILSQSMKDMLLDVMYFYLDTPIANEWIEKVHVFEPSVSYSELSQIKNLYHYREDQKKIITFPGRLSEGEQSRTNWDKFMIAIQELGLTRDDYIVYITDPNNSWHWNPGGILRKIDKDRTQFLNLLEQTDIIVSLMAIQGFGGIAIREALQFGCMPVIPYVGEYKNMKPPLYEGFIEGEITVAEIVDKLNFALDNVEYHNQYLRANEITNAYKYTIESQMPKLMGVIING